MYSCVRPTIGTFFPLIPPLAHLPTIPPSARLPTIPPLAHLPTILPHTDNLCIFIFFIFLMDSLVVDWVVISKTLSKGHIEAMSCIRKRNLRKVLEEFI